MPSVDAYLAKVFKSIKQNTRSVAGETDKIERLVDCIRKFYVSLFAADQGKRAFVCFFRRFFFPSRSAAVTQL